MAQNDFYKYRRFEEELPSAEIATISLSELREFVESLTSKGIEYYISFGRQYRRLELFTYDPQNNQIDVKEIKFPDDSKSQTLIIEAVGSQTSQEEKGVTDALKSIAPENMPGIRVYSRYQVIRHVNKDSPDQTESVNFHLAHPNMRGGGADRVCLSRFLACYKKSFRLTSQI